MTGDADTQALQAGPGVPRWLSSGSPGPAVAASTAGIHCLRPGGWASEVQVSSAGLVLEASPGLQRPPLSVSTWCPDLFFL